MKPDENEVEIKNATLTLASIREDTNKEASLLTSLLEGKAKVLKETAESKAELEKEREAIKSERAVLATERVDNLYTKSNADSAVKRADEELKIVNSQKNEAMRELSRLNDWNMKAEEEKKVLGQSIEDLKKEEEERLKIILDIENLEERKKEAEKTLNQVKIETSLLIDETSNNVANLNKEAELAVERQNEAQEARSVAEIALYDLNNERVRVRGDLDVCIDRVEKVYNKAFPELRMKI